MRCGRRQRPRRDELRAVQISRADRRLRAASRRPAARASSQSARPGYQNNQNEMPAERVVDRPYEPHPIEAESMRMIEAGRDWSRFSVNDARILKRLVHTSGDFSIVEDIFISAG